MSFLYPAFLFGLIALAIPIVIHLFDFRRTKKVYFSNTRLLDQVKESTRSFYNLKQLLILLSRLLFIASLVLAFTQPFIAPKGEEGLKATNVGVFIDNSYSMSNRVGQDESGLSVIKETAAELINLYPAGTKFLIRSAYEESSVNFYLSKSAALKKISELEFASNTNSMNTVLNSFKESIGSVPPRDIILLSDFQQSTLLSETVIPDSATHYIIVPVLYESQENVSIDSAYISNPFELDKSKTNLVVRIRNYSEREKRDLSVKLFMGDRQLSVTTIDIPASSFTNIDFTIGQGVDQEEGYVLVEDYPLSFDNILYFNRKSVNKVNISHIHSNTSGQYVSAVYGNSALFNLVTMPESNINYTALEGSDIIILNGLTALDTNLAERVQSLRSRGVTVLIIPSESPDINTYRPLADRLRTIGKLDEDIDLEAPDFNRPFYKNVLERRDNNLRMPVAQPVWSWGGDRNALVKFIDGQPFLSELYRGFYLLASPLDNAYTNFQHNALFVPIMYRIAANSKQNIDPLYYRIDGNEISVAYENLESNAIIRLKNDDIEFLPDQRLTGRSIEMLLPTGVVPAGHYNILNNQEEIKKIALNYKTDESDIIASTEDDLIETFMGYDYNILSGSGSKEIVTKFSADYKGIMLWRYFLGLALVFLFIEALLIRLL